MLDDSNIEEEFATQTFVSGLENKEEYSEWGVNSFQAIIIVLVN